MDALKAQFKAIAGALVGAIVSVLTTTVTDPDSVVNPDSVDGNAIVQLPNTQAEWVSFGVAVLLGWATVFFAPRNQQPVSTTYRRDPTV